MRYRTGGTVAVGDKLTDGEKDAGRVINVSGEDLLAVTPVNMRDKELFVNGVAVTPVAMPYALPVS